MAYYISDLDGSNQVNFDIDPEPVPKLSRDRRVIVRSLFPSKSGTNYIAGQSSFTDLGSSYYGSRINIILNYITDTKLDLLLNKFAYPSSEKIKIVKFYHEEENVRYTCIWDGSQSLNYKRLQGIGSDWYNVNINLIIIDREDLSVLADEKVKISSNDTVADYLIIKLIAGQAVILTEIGDPGNETLQVAVQDATTGQKGVVQYGTTPSTACQGNDTRIPSNTVLSKSANYTILITDGNGHKIEVDTSGGNVQIDFPAAATWTGWAFHITKIDVANSVILKPNGAETINGAASFTFSSQWQTISVYSNGTALRIL